jgi:hypothetical protein
VFAIGQCAGHFHRYWHRSEQPIQKKCVRLAAKHYRVGGTGRGHAYGEWTGQPRFWEVSDSHASRFEDFCRPGCDVI